MRLIDADAIHEFVDHKLAEGTEYWAGGVPLEWACALAVINAASTIDAAPVRRSEWKDESYDPVACPGDVLRCTACGKLANDYIRGYEDAYFWENPNFCPHCGADMRGETDEHRPD